MIMNKDTIDITDIDLELVRLCKEIIRVEEEADSLLKEKECLFSTWDEASNSMVNSYNSKDKEKYHNSIGEMNSIVGMLKNVEFKLQELEKEHTRLLNMVELFDSEGRGGI